MQRGSKRLPNSPHAAFLVDTAPQFTELNRVARVLQRSGWGITFIFDGGYRAVERDLRTCRETGYDIVPPPKTRAALAGIRSWLSRLKTGARSGFGLKAAVRSGLRRAGNVLHGRPINTPAPAIIIDQEATPAKVEPVPKYFTVSMPRLLARHTRMRIRRWRRKPTPATLPALAFDIMGTLINLFPTLVKYVFRVWLPYKIWQVRRSIYLTTRRSRFDPVWLFRFFVGTLVPYWTQYLKIYLRQAKLLRNTPGPIDAPNVLPGLHDFSESSLNHTPADFEILRIQGRFLDHQELLLKHQVDVLILAKDCAYYQTGFWVEAARQIQVPTILIPFDDADTTALAEHRAGHRDHVITSDYARAVAEKYPEWVMHWAGEDLILLPPELVEARARLGLTPANPWAYNSTRCDKVLVESEAKRLKMLGEHAPADQVIATGTVFQDMLAHNVADAEVKRRALLKQLGLQDNKLLVLASVTPNKVAERSVPIDFTNYRKMLDYWISRITHGGRFNVILCLHPSVDQKEVAFLERYGAHIIRQDTASLIPLCDVYVVDCSATSRWALAAGKLVLDYDLYRYNLAFHSKLPGIIHMMEKPEFETTLDQLASGELDILRSEVRANAQNHLFGRLDGQAAKRIEAACAARLVERTPLPEAQLDSAAAALD